MPILDKNDKIQVEKYNSYVKGSTYANAMQDLNWGKVKSAWLQEAVYVEKDGEIIAAMTILLEKLPIIKSYFMYASKAPICDVYDIDLVEELVKEADILAKKYKAFCLKFDPEVRVDYKLVKMYKDRGYIVMHESKDKDKLIQPKFNAILDIENKTEDEIMRGFAEKTRYNIRLSTKKGVNVRFSRDIDYLKKFYELYKITTLRDKIGCRKYSYFVNMLDAYGEDNLRIYLAEHENDILAAAIALKYGKKMFYIYGASSNEKRNLMPNYLMQWEMIKWGIETGCKEYDFGGVLDLNPENGLYKFKMGFCKKDGLTEYLGEIDKIYNKFLYKVVNEALPMVKKLKKKIKSLLGNKV